MSTPPANQSMLDQIARRRLALPALLWLTAAQPLHFVAGHLLVALAPLAGVLGLERVGAWGEELSDPERVAAWRRQLERAVDERDGRDRYEGRA